MRQNAQITTAAAAVLLLTFTTSVSAQLTNLPDLSTATQRTTAKSTAASSAATTAASTSQASSAAASSASDSSFIATTTGAATATSSNSVFHLTGLPTIEGAGIPTLVIPYTADAPFMQKSSLPEGTVFIVVGAVLGFLGACVLAWRGLVAYSINQSVKKAALASIMASDTKTPGGWMTNPLSKPSRGVYSHAPDGSSLSLDALTSTGKPIASARQSRVPPSSNTSGLFFSPTASAGTPMAGLSGNRSSTYLPAGYYASPSSQAAGGAGSTTLGANLASPTRRSQYIDHSPPGSPGPYSRRASKNAGLQLPSDGRGASRPTSTSLLNPNIGLHPQASSSSLGVNTGHGEDLPGSRAPSAYLEDLFENHGNGPRERF